MPLDLHDVVAGIVPLDESERHDQATALAWLESGSPIYRIAKPATPPEHLVSYCVLVDPKRRSVLLVDHRDAGLWLATGGHVDVDEDPAVAATRELREELAVSPPFMAGLEALPLFITRTTTQGVSAGHTDVSLWYVFEGSEGDDLQPDPNEFVETRWWSVDEIHHGADTRFGSELPRFIAKLTRRWKTTQPPAGYWLASCCIKPIAGPQSPHTECDGEPVA